MSEYEQNINSLIPFAEKEAHRKVTELGKKREPRTGKDGKLFYWDFWSEFFHAAMNSMSRKEGYRGLK